MDDDQQIAKLNARYFGTADTYSEAKYVKKMKRILYAEAGIIVAYVLYKERRKYLEGFRSATKFSHRRRGLAAQLYAQVASLADSKGKKYKMFADIANYASINAHIKCGMLVTKIDVRERWVYMST